MATVETREANRNEGARGVAGNAQSGGHRAKSNNSSAKKRIKRRGKASLDGPGLLSFLVGPHRINETRQLYQPNGAS